MEKKKRDGGKKVEQTFESTLGIKWRSGKMEFQDQNKK